MLFVLAVAAVGVYGIVLAGWSSGSTYPLLGGLRSTAQVISYEIAMGLSLVAVFLYAGSMSTSQIVAAQQHASGTSCPAVLLLRRSTSCRWSVRPTARRSTSPEAEGELVGGFHTEYSSLKFALFFLAEYINMVTVSALATTLFLGGWRAPWPISLIGDGANTGWWPVLWFVVKLVAFMFVFIWLRGTLPRLRYDQFMRFGWKVLIPITLLWIIAVAIDARRCAGDLGDGKIARWPWSSAATGRLVSVIAVIALASPDGTARREAELAEAERGRPRDVDPFDGGYPVPPMPGQRLRPPAWRWLWQRSPAPRHRAVSAGAVVHRSRRRPLRRPRWLTDPRRQPRARGGEAKGLLSGILAPVAGFGVTFATMFRKVATEEYPEKPSARPRRASTAGTSSTGTPTASRSASGASCAPGPARPTRSRRGRRQRRPEDGSGVSRRGSGTAASTRSTTCAASSAVCASRRARPARSR